MNTKKQKLLWVCGLVLVLLPLGLGVYLVEAERACRVDCSGRLASLGRCLRMYAADHAGQFPPSFRDVLPYTGSNAFLFLCPSTRTRPGTMAAADSWTDYLYVAGLRESDPPDMPLVMDKPTNHRTLFGAAAGGLVLYVDGHWSWVPSPRFEALLNEPWSACKPVTWNEGRDAEQVVTLALISNVASRAKMMNR